MKNLKWFIIRNAVVYVCIQLWHFFVSGSILTLQEIVCWYVLPLGRITTRFLWSCLEHLEILVQILVELENCRHITAAVAVVRGRPYSYQCI